MDKALDTAKLDGLTAAATSNYPLSERDAAWDAAAASKRWQDECGIGGDSPDWDKFHGGFFWHDPDKAENVTGHKLGFVDVVDGKATAIWKGITAAAGAVQGARGGVDIPEGDVAGVKTRIEKYYADAKTKYDDDGIKAPWDAENASATMLAYAEVGNVTLILDDHGLVIGATASDDDAMAAYVDRLTYWDASPAQAMMDSLRERLQHTVRCDCGHPFSDHLGSSGPCSHEDGRGTCSCSSYSEAPVAESAQNTVDGLAAAAGDLVWGPEDGLVDLLCDVDELLRAMDVYGYCACDATVDLTRVLVCDYSGDECWVIPITIGDDREPVLAPMEEWKAVEQGWVEVASDSYRARVDAARNALPIAEGDEDRATVSRMTLRLTSLRAAGDGVELIPEHEPRDDRPDAHASPDEPAAMRGPLEWDAIFAPEGKMTDDRRVIAPGALTWRELPLSLGAMLDTPHADVVTNSQVCGRIDNIWRDEASGLIRASGVFDEGDYGREIARMVTDGTLRGISVDLAIHQYEVGPKSSYFNEEGTWAPKAQTADEPTLVDLLFGEPEEPPIYVITDAVIGATTVCPFPAFAEANIQAASSLVAGSNPAIWTVTSSHGFRVVQRPAPEVGEVIANAEIAVHEGLTASAEGLAPELPPADWFADPGLEEPTALVVDADGRVFGHAATWDTCHIAFADTCVTPPHSEAEYTYFHLGEIACADGERISCGQITLGTGHAGLTLGRAAATAHYDDTGLAVADVAVGEDDYGIWVAGAIRPDVDAARVRELMGAKLSGDWRRIDEGPLELVALLAVNVPGFPVPRQPRAVVASGDDGEQVLALVAAGIPGALTDADRDRLRDLGTKAA